jgi:flagellar biosynthesis chaperone FliJ
MARDPLESVLRIRRMTVDDARRALAQSLRHEEVARHRAEAAEALIYREGEIAADLSVGDGAVEAYAAWLPTGRALLQVARAAHEQCSSDVAIARAALTIARAASEAASNLLARRVAEQNILLERRSQNLMDEVASRQREDGVPTDLPQN